MSKATDNELYFSINNEDYVQADREWYQDNLDIVVPVMIIMAGLFQYILRKWILPVTEDFLSELHEKLPSQVLMYNPKFGVILMVAGAIFLIIFNLDLLF